MNNIEESRKLAHACIDSSRPRYDWSKLDAGWSYHPNEGSGGVLKNHDGATWIGSVTVEHLEELPRYEGSFTRGARAQLDKCRVEAPNERYDWSKLDDGWAYYPQTKMLRLGDDRGFAVGRLETQSGPLRAALMPLWSEAQGQLAKCRIPEPVDVDTRDWQALTEENERLKTELTRYQLLARESEQSRSISESQVMRLTEQIRKLQEKPSDWRDEVKQSLKGNDGGLVLWDVSDTLLRISPNMVHHDTFYVSLSNARTYALTEGVRNLEDVLRLSLVIERLKKLGWTEAK